MSSSLFCKIVVGAFMLVGMAGVVVVGAIGFTAGATGVVDVVDGVVDVGATGVTGVAICVAATLTEVANVERFSM